MEQFKAPMAHRAGVGFYDVAVTCPQDGCWRTQLQILVYEESDISKESQVLPHVRKPAFALVFDIVDVFLLPLSWYLYAGMFLNVGCDADTFRSNNLLC